MRVLCVAAVFLGLLASTSHGLFPLEPPETVAELDIPTYAGRWYQVAANRFVYWIFEQNGVCITADYVVVNSTTVTVRNANRISNPTGRFNDIRGFAYTYGKPGQLRVQLADLYPAPYWVLKLGPIENGQYQYAVVSDPWRFFLFIIARDVDEYWSRFHDDVAEFLKDTGFVGFFLSPVRTVHKDTCLYADPAEA